MEKIHRRGTPASERGSLSRKKDATETKRKRKGFFSEGEGGTIGRNKESSGSARRSARKETGVLKKKKGLPASTGDPKERWTFRTSRRFKGGEVEKRQKKKERRVSVHRKEGGGGGGGGGGGRQVLDKICRNALSIHPGTPKAKGQSREKGGRLSRCTRKKEKISYARRKQSSQRPRITPKLAGEETP